ncbi:MAG TPA: response regulator [Burkholderiaceae bacterium]|nr:response regulator [Burkholderiaceae bacterium]
MASTAWTMAVGAYCLVHGTGGGAVDARAMLAALAQPALLCIAAATGLLAMAAGLALAQHLMRPIKALTRRAEDLAIRFAGRETPRSGNEFDSLVASFDAMTKALLAHSARLQRAHLGEMQKGLELQRQYALMRLLRSLAATANESLGVDETLTRALNEIGEFLDWPLGRVVLPADAGEGAPVRSVWWVRDPARYRPFVEVSEATPLLRNSTGLIGRAFASGTPHWVSDLGAMDGWARRDAAVACGLRSGFVIPVVGQGHATAFIEFFCGDRVEATPRMLELIGAVGDELWRIGERQRHERELRLRANEARQLALVAATTDSGAIVTDATRRIEWANASMLRLIGSTLERLRGRPLVETLVGSPGENADAQRLAAELDACGALTGVELHLASPSHRRSPDMPSPDTPSPDMPSRAGNAPWVELEIRPVRDDAGDVTNYIAIAKDISARKRDEQSLREREEYFRALFDDSPLPAVIQGPDRVVLRANAACLRLFAVDSARMVGADLVEFVHPDDAASMLALHEGADGGLPATPQVERRFVRGDGAVVTVRMHGGRIAAADGTTNLVTVFDDVTQDMEAARALREAKDNAEQANRAKSQFLANMSHEIRTPMNGVLGMTELLLGTTLNDRQRRFAEAVYRSGEGLLSVINDILDFSKIEAGRLELESLDFDLRALVEDEFELLAPRADSKGIELAYRIGAAVPRWVRGDPTRLRQVLANLVGNAIKFTDHGEVVVEVDVEDAAAGSATARDVENGTAAAHRIRFEVRDTGIGIRAELLPRLFTMFMQADQSMTRRYGGTGLGLAISRQLVALMDGSIRAESRLGEGSTFRFDIALAAAVDRAAREPAAPVALGGRRVVVVEDNPTNRRLLENQLGACGLDCAVAENGSQALQLIRAAARAGTPFELALVDMKMPGMDGIELARILRGDDLTAGIRLILLSSMSSGDEVRAAREAGIDVVLAKPVRHHDLIGGLAKALAGADDVAQEVARAVAGARVLLVEDNAVNQELVCAMLATLGCRVETAGDGRRALEALERTRFDLVLMDCQMPEMDGFEAVRRIRAAADEPGRFAVSSSVPIVALTANALAGDAERCRNAGFSDYLAKPFKRAQLEAAIARWVGGPRARPLPHASDAAVAQAEPPREPGRAADAAAADAGPAAPRPSEASDETGGAPILDASVLDRIRDMERRGAANLLGRLVDAYVASSTRLVDEADDALLAGEADRLVLATHTLKSASANLGAVELSRCCASIEALARLNRIEEAGAEWQGMRGRHERVVAALRAVSAATADAAPSPIGAVGAALA